MSIDNRGLEDLQIVTLICNDEFQPSGCSCFLQGGIAQSACNGCDTELIDGEALRHGLEQHKLSINIALIRLDTTQWVVDVETQQGTGVSAPRLNDGWFIVVEQLETAP